MSLVLEERSVEVAGHDVRYRVAGEGPPLVLVHGLSGSSRWWTPVLPELAKRRTVLLVDLPGFGSLGRRSRFVFSEASGWLLDWITAAEVGRPSLVGHSMGAAIAVRAAAARPDAFERLVLAAPAGLVARPLLAHGVPFALALRHVRPRFGSVLVRDALVAGPRTLLRASFEVANADVRPDLRRVTAPTLVVVGGRDPLVPPAVAEVVRSELAGTQVVVLEEAAHVPMFDRPHEFAEAVLEFLDQASSDSKERTMRPRSRGRE